MPTSLIPGIFKAICFASTDKSLSDIIEAKITECAAGKHLPEYFWLTELVNPMDAYWQRISPMPQPINILKKLKYGQKMHYVSRFWFQRLPGYAVAEATLNGFYVNIPGVVGKVDYAIKDSIFEFKTKEKATIRVDDVLDLYPHDLEQILFYATLSPKRPRTNYLVYMTKAKDGSPRFFAFRVTIKDFNPLEAELRHRMALLAGCVSRHDPSGLFQCRYFGPGCRFDGAGICGCRSVSAVGARPLLSAVTIERDDELSRKVAELYEATSLEKAGFELWNLILPRKLYHKHFDYSIDEELATYSGLDPDKLSLLALIDSAVGASDLGVSSGEKKRLSSEDHLGITGARRFMKVNVPARAKGTMIVPYIVKQHKGERIPGEKRLPDIYYSELGLQCARSGISTGVIVTHFPKAKERTVCYVIGFVLEDVTHAAKSAKEALREALHHGTPEGLDKCPDYMQSHCQFKGCSCIEGPRAG